VYISEQQDMQAVLFPVLLVDMSASQYEFHILIYNDLSFVFINQIILRLRHVISDIPKIYSNEKLHIFQITWYVPFMCLH
jgi:hypothetical protein